VREQRGKEIMAVPLMAPRNMAVVVVVAQAQ
jgi:hypothetical protein